MWALRCRDFGSSSLARACPAPRASPAWAAMLGARLSRSGRASLRLSPLPRWSRSLRIRCLGATPWRRSRAPWTCRTRPLSPTTGNGAASPSSPSTTLAWRWGVPSLAMRASPSATFAPTCPTSCASAGPKRPMESSRASGARLPRRRRWRSARSPRPPWAALRQGTRRMTCHAGHAVTGTTTAQRRSVTSLDCHGPPIYVTTTGWAGSEHSQVASRALRGVGRGLRGGSDGRSSRATAPCASPSASPSRDDG
mmetsp:Transcript_9048/g.24901  ORF Transcript_9048/g.24901 Transcript_9048/m.24901 type:complete len:253 (+) Transcript_9048:482-1240(+)